MFVTERAVLSPNSEGKVTLIDVTPGIDVEKDLLQQIEVPVEIAKDLTPMDVRLFAKKHLGLTKSRLPSQQKLILLQRKEGDHNY